MSSLSKAAVQIALEASGEARPDFLVFCSQHGDLARLGELLRAIATGVELSPTTFSQSVHNTSAGLFTIIAESCVPATSLASGASTFAYGWLEAEGFLAEHPDARVLVVTFDEALPDEYLPYSTQRPCGYALGLLLRAAGERGFSLQTAAPESDEPLPMAPVFMAWVLSADPTLRVTADGQGWTWTKNRS
jgi:hypothetical protein